MTDRTSTADGTHRSATVCIAGGGPAGVVLGLLLGRAGVDVVVLEKHADFRAGPAAATSRPRSV